MIKYFILYLLSPFWTYFNLSLCITCLAVVMVIIVMHLLVNSLSALLYFSGYLEYIFHSHSSKIIDRNPIFLVAVSQHVMVIFTLKIIPVMVHYGN